MSSSSLTVTELVPAGVGLTVRLPFCGFLRTAWSHGPSSEPRGACLRGCLGFTLTIPATDGATTAELGLQELSREGKEDTKEEA
jgi:hypothetical protein